MVRQTFGIITMFAVWFGRRICPRAQDICQTRSHGRNVRHRDTAEVGLEADGDYYSLS